MSFLSRNRNRILWALAGMSLYRSLKTYNRKIQFLGRVAVVSGGSRGLGLIMARQLAAQGAIVALLARDEDALRRAREQILQETPQAQVTTVSVDITDQKEVEEAILAIMTRLGRIDILINNAGIVSVMPHENAAVEDYEQAMKTHFWGPLYLIRASLPFMKDGGGGRIVNIISIGGKLGVPHLAPYCASKFALSGLSDCLRAELIKDNIYVTSVFPGLMRTGSIRHGKFRGQREKEFSWFAVSDSLPGLSVNAERASQEILEACRLGRAELVISGPAKVATTFRTLFPEINADILSWVNRALPGPVEGVNESIEGHFLNSKVTSSVLTRLSEKAAQKHNEVPLH